MSKITEQDSLYRHLEKMTTVELLTNINKEDQKVATAVESCIPAINKFIDAAFEKLDQGGRLFYIGAGTSGRLGILDASECPPTFGVSHDLVVGLMAGGDAAIRKAVEFAEDDTEQAFKDLKKYDIDDNDVLIGIAASGTTPYVLGGLKAANKVNIITGCITCNPNSPLDQLAKYPMVIEVGPEFVTGSTRMKSGTAQKLVLNMISTTLMIKMGRVLDNKMVDMQLSNNKLVDRGTKMVMKKTDLNYEEAQKMLTKHGSVRATIQDYNSK